MCQLYICDIVNICCFECGIHLSCNTSICLKELIVFMLSDIIYENHLANELNHIFVSILTGDHFSRNLSSFCARDLPLKSRVVYRLVFGKRPIGKM